MGIHGDIVYERAGRTELDADVFLVPDPELNDAFELDPNPGDHPRPGARPLPAVARPRALPGSKSTIGRTSLEFQQLILQRCEHTKEEVKWLEDSKLQQVNLECHSLTSRCIWNVLCCILFFRFLDKTCVFFICNMYSYAF
ncbi:hypothetical protein EJB05_27548, partial [Eragrostis curvula]